MVVTELQIRLKQGDPVYVACDSYKEEEETDNNVTRRWLRLYRGGDRIGQYDFNEIVGYHEEAPTPPPQRVR